MKRKIQRLCACAIGVLFLTVLSVPASRARQATRTAPPAFAKEILAAHNAVRARVKVAPLEWSEQLAAVSRNWAETLLAKRQFVHSDSPFGENLFDITGAAATPAVVVKHWAVESLNYDYANNACRGLCGHYTQIVWRDSRRVGCGVARGGGREVWVCSYDPPGNFVGMRPY